MTDAPEGTVAGSREVVSHHLIRRTARKRRRQLDARQTAAAATGSIEVRYRYRVEPSIRGPFGWYVVAYRIA